MRWGALEVAYRNRAGTALSDYVDIPCGRHRGRRITRVLDDQEIDIQELPYNIGKMRMDWVSKLWPWAISPGARMAPRGC
jgi:hypothetical protein